MKHVATQILDDWRITTMGRLCDGLRLLLDNTGDTLVDVAAKTESIDLQTTLFDARHILDRHQDRLLVRFHEALEKAEASAPATRPEPGGDTLSLVEQEAFERSVALETIANNCILRNRQNFHAFEQRMSALHGGRRFQTDDLPLNPRRIATVFERILAPVDISSKVRLILFTLFDRYVISQLDDAVSEINRLLAEAGVLPRIKYQIRKEGRIVTAPVPEKTAQVSQAPSVGNDTAVPSGTAVTRQYTSTGEPIATADDHQDTAPNAAQTMDAIIKLVSARRRQHANKAQGDTASHAAISPQESQRRVLEALDSPQIQQQTPNQAPQVLTARENKIIVDKELLLRVRDALKKQRAMINSLMGGSKNIGEREQDAIEIVGMLFEAMLDDQTLPAQLKALLSHLHTPFLKIAIKDPNCLRDTNHPARLLLGDMLQLGLRWVDPEKLRSGIYPTLQYCVRKIIDAPEQVDYQALEGELKRKAAQLEQAGKVSEKRTLDAEKGKTMLSRARDTAESATEALLQTHRLPSAVRIFFQTIFTDYLTLLLLRNDLDPKHPKCREPLNAAVSLIESVDRREVVPAQDAGKALKQLIEQLLPHYQNKIDTFLGQLASTITSSNEEKTDTGADTTPVPAAGLKQPEVDEAVIARIMDIPADSWFLLQKDPEEQPLMVKLLWSNPHTHHVLFVDQHGQKRVRMSMGEVSSQLDNGSLKPIDIKSESVFGKLLSAIRHRLETKPATGTAQ